MSGVLTKLQHYRQTRVRLQGIDAPESRQAFGRVSKRSLSGVLIDTDRERKPAMLRPHHLLKESLRWEG